MARPYKHSVDYFPHDSDASDGRTLTILFNTFGHDGISAWWQLLERISCTENHVIDIRNPDDLEYLSAKLRFTPEKLRQILDKLAYLNAIDFQLYSCGLIWSDNFVERVSDVYKKRKQELPTRPVIGTGNPVNDTRKCVICDTPLENSRSDSKYCSDKCRQKAHRVTDMSRIAVTEKNVNSPETELMTPETELMTPETELMTPISTQRKGKERKGKEIKKRNIKEKIEIPDWINPESWNSFLEMRDEIKSPPTKKAMNQIIIKLGRLRDEGNDPNDVLNESTMNNWKGVFALKKQSNQNSKETICSW